MKRICIALIVAAIAISGCGKPEDKFVGTWNGEMFLSHETLDAMFSMLAPAIKEASTNAMENLEIILELKEDGTYAQTNTTPLTSTTFTGTWTLNDDGSRLTISAPDKNEQVQAWFSAVGLSDALLETTYDVKDDGMTLHAEQETMGFKYGMTFKKN